jgi:hypothetical protein
MELGTEALATISDETVANCVKHVWNLEMWLWEKEGVGDYANPFVIPLEDDEFDEWGLESEEETHDEDPYQELNVWD